LGLYFESWNLENDAGGCNFRYQLGERTEHINLHDVVSALQSGKCRNELWDTNQESSIKSRESMHTNWGIFISEYHVCGSSNQA
jgi:hypothetical protein